MSGAAQARTINEEKMNAFLGKVVGDFGALRALASEESLRKVRQFRRATETPFNRIFEARN